MQENKQVPKGGTMTTIVNNPSSDSGSSMGMIVGLILLAVIVGLFFIYGLPALRQSTSQPTINVPDSIDVNIQPPAGGVPGVPDGSGQ